MRRDFVRSRPLLLLAALTVTIFYLGGTGDHGRWHPIQPPAGYQLGAFASVGSDSWDTEYRPLESQANLGRGSGQPPAGDITRAPDLDGQLPTDSGRRLSLLAPAANGRQLWRGRAPPTARHGR